VAPTPLPVLVTFPPPPTPPITPLAGQAPAGEAPGTEVDLATGPEEPSKGEKEITLGGKPPSDPALAETTEDPGLIAGATTETVPPTVAITPLTTREDPAGPLFCQRPAGWVAYTVRVNDTLFSLARQTNTTVTSIRQANCLASDLIFAGQILYLPFLPKPPAEPATAEPPSPTTALAGTTAEAEESPKATSPPTNTPTNTPTSTVEVLQPPGPGGERVAVSPPSGPPGTMFTVLIESFQPDEAITLRIIFADTFELIVEESLVVNKQGDYTYIYTSPVDAAAGDYRVWAFGAEAEANGEFTITGGSAVGVSTPTATATFTPMPAPSATPSPTPLPPATAEPTEPLPATSTPTTAPSP